jgi:hypothetical protein
VKKIRPDLVIIDRELLRRSWYYTYIQRHYPEIYNNSKAEIDRFLPDLDKFEHDLPYDQASIMKSFEELQTSFVVNNPNRRYIQHGKSNKTKTSPLPKNTAGSLTGFCSAG